MRGTKTDLAKEIINKYIEIGIKNNKGYSKRFIATQLYNENPEIFSNIEEARSIIRLVTNSTGTKSKSKSYEELTNRFALISDQVEEINYEPFIVPKAYKKTLWIADLHSRFCDKQALITAMKYGVKEKYDSVIINGDFMDFFSFSRFDKSPSIKKHFEEEKEWGQEILNLLQDTFGYVVLKQGNHDMRRENYITKLSMEMPEFEGISTYEDFLMFDRSNVQFVKDYNYIKYGNLYGIHGHEYQGGGGIHTAYSRLNKAMDNVISAHSHKSQTSIKTSISGKIYGSWSLGCLCHLHPRYAPKNDWNQGFAITEKDNKGDFEVHNKLILGTKILSI